MLSDLGVEARLARLERRDRRVARLAEVLFDTDLVGVRLVLAGAEIIWAITLLWPGSVFAHETYSMLKCVMPEYLWGLLFAGTAWVQWSLIVIGDFRCMFARVFAAWNSVLWLSVVVGMYLSTYPPPAAISGETALALAALWIFLRPLIYKGSAD